DWTSLNTGPEGDAGIVNATTGSLYVYNSGGQDYTYVGSDTTDSINGPVNVSGAGATNLSVTDNGPASPHTVVLDDGLLTGLTPAAVSWTPSAAPTGGVTQLVVGGSQGDRTYTINNTDNLYNGTTLETGSGDDTVNVNATTGSLYDFNTGGDDHTYIGNGS